MNKKLAFYLIIFLQFSLFISSCKTAEKLPTSDDKNKLENFKYDYLVKPIPSTEKSEPGDYTILEAKQKGKFLEMVVIPVSGFKKYAYKMLSLPSSASSIHPAITLLLIQDATERTEIKNQEFTIKVDLTDLINMEKHGEIQQIKFTNSSIQIEFKIP